MVKPSRESRMRPGDREKLIKFFKSPEGMDFAVKEIQREIDKEIIKSMKLKEESK